MKDEEGLAQLWTVSPTGGAPIQVTRQECPVASAFTWSPDGRLVAMIMDGSVVVTEMATGRTRRLTERRDEASAPRPEACVFSPDGSQIAYVRPVAVGARRFNQIFTVALP